jgi:hypothetical protein
MAGGDLRDIGDFRAAEAERVARALLLRFALKAKLAVDETAAKRWSSPAPD